MIDVFSRRIVGSRVTSPLKSDLALDALEQAICERNEACEDWLVHHSDRGVQYLSIRYTERLAEAGIEPSVSSSRSATFRRWSTRTLSIAARKLSRVSRHSRDRVPGKSGAVHLLYCETIRIVGVAHRARRGGRTSTSLQRRPKAMDVVACLIRMVK